MKDTCDSFQISAQEKARTERGHLLATAMLCKSAFFICAVPRSGSSLLCDLLQRTGVAGNPMEYGEQDDEETWRRGHGFSDHRSYFLHFVHRLSVTANGVFSAKLMFEQMYAFALDLAQYKLIGTGDMISTIDVAFGGPRYIQVLRKDKEHQAISFVRAAQTGAWTWTQASTKSADYDPALLERAEDFLRGKEDAWNEALRGVDPSRRMTLHYEDIVENMEATVAQLLNWLQITDYPRPFEQPLMKRQSDTMTEEWLSAWRSHKQLTEKPL